MTNLYTIVYAISRTNTFTASIVKPNFKEINISLSIKNDEIQHFMIYHLYDADPIEIQVDLHLAHDRHFEINATLQLA